MQNKTTREPETFERLQILPCPRKTGSKWETKESQV